MSVLLFPLPELPCGDAQERCPQAPQASEEQSELVATLFAIAAAGSGREQDRLFRLIPSNALERALTERAV